MFKIQVTSCSKGCPFFRSTEYSGIYCSWFPFVTEEKGMVSLIDENTKDLPDICPLRRGAVTIEME